MDKKEAIEVFYEDIDDKKYYTIEEVSSLVGIDQSKIEYYYNKLNKFLEITSVGMFQVFTKEDVENLKRIKRLDIDKNMSMDDIKHHLETHRQEIIIKQEDKIDVSFLDFLAQVMNNQNNKIDNVIQQNEKLVNIIEKIAENQDKLIENQKAMNDKMNSIEKEIAVTQESNDKIDGLKLLLEERKEEYNNKKGFWSRLLGK
jgi:DNA-binding transcriptional MerR regulator